MGAYRLLGWISKKETTKSSVWSCLLRKFTVEVFILKTAIREGNVPIGCLGVQKLDFCHILMIWLNLNLFSFLCIEHSRTTFLLIFGLYMKCNLICIISKCFACLLACLLLACLLAYLSIHLLVFFIFWAVFVRIE